jgi:arginyl-tRNA synthetase
LLHFQKMASNIKTHLSEQISLALKTAFNLDIDTKAILLQKTRKEFEGDYTLVVFPYTKAAGKSPEATAQIVGEQLLANGAISKFNIVKGFLNLQLPDADWANFFQENFTAPNFGILPSGSNGKTVMVEYSSPNTNKPLHLGHVRNNLLGFSVAEILSAAGYKVIKTNIVNDRGVHICKSMLAWQKFANGETPASSGLKGDHLVGKYYVAFDKAYKAEVEALINTGVEKEKAEKEAPLIKEVQAMLKAWETGDTEVVALWKKMNGWVYEGFDVTYKALGVDFHKTYYESDTYLLGKDIVEEGLKKNVFYKKEDGSIRIDLTAEGLDEKVVLRSDGTSVYITQDLGTALERFKDYKDLSYMIYTVGNEQDYHFKVLFMILAKLGYAWAKDCYHLSYGMVELPEGKMKSREGTVVDADDLIHEMISTAESTTKALGKFENFESEEANELYKTIGLGALKYFILKVDAKKKMMFNPSESIDFNGNTGPFIQYTYARIQSVLRNGNFNASTLNSIELNDKEKELVKYIFDFNETILEAAKQYNPALIANYVYELVKIYNQFYNDYSVLKAETEALKQQRMALSFMTGNVIKNSMKLLGVPVPNKM